MACLLPRWPIEPFTLGAIGRGSLAVFGSLAPSIMPVRLFTIVLALTLAACEKKEVASQGPPGSAGPPGPLAARAQQPEGIRRLAIIMLTADDADGQARITALREGLEKLGWTAHNGTWQCAPRINSAVHTH